MRIFATVGLKQQPAGDTRVALAELCPQLPHIGQLALVILQQFPAHTLVHRILSAGQVQHRVEADLFWSRVHADLPFNVEA